MGLGDIVTSGFKDYKKNFNIAWRTYFWFALIPVLFSSIFLLSTGLYIYEVKDLFFNHGSFVTGFLIGYIVVYIFLSIWTSLTIYYAALKNKGKMNFKESASGGIKYFWNLIGISIITILIFLVPFALMAFAFYLVKNVLIGIISAVITLGLFILMIRILVYWTFSFYAAFDKNLGVFASLKESKKIVSGRWWKVFGYMIVLYLLVLCFFVGGGIVKIPLSILLYFITNPLAIAILNLIGSVIDIAVTCVATPLMILFLKNFYMQEKNKK